MTRRRALLSLLLLIAFNGVISVGFINNARTLQARETEIVQTRMNIDSLLVAEWIRASFDVTDYALRDILGHVQVDDLRYPHPDASAQAALSERIVAVMQTVPSAFWVGLLDAACVVTHTNAVLGFDASDRDYCRDLRDDPARDTTVSSVDVSDTGELSITLARRLPSDDGSFVGMAALALDLDFIASFLDRVLLLEGANLVVFDDGMRLVARRPAVDVPLGTVIDDADTATFVRDDARIAEGRTVSPLDGHERLYVIRSIDGLPLNVGRGIRVDAFLAEWRFVTLRGGLLVTLLWGLGIVALRAHWRTLLQADALNALAHTDELTGLHNRRSFVQLADLALERSLRSGRPLALALIDLDGLKHVNDRYGHAAGDAALRAFADVLQSTTRRIDHAARFGGDEFALLLSDLSGESALAIAERVRDSVRDRDVHATDGQPLRLSASIGLVCLAPIPAVPSAAAPVPTLDALLSAADAALYEAKRQGRDRVVVAPPKAVA